MCLLDSHTMMCRATKPGVFRKSLKMAVGTRGLFMSREAPEVVMLLTGMQNHTVAFDVHSSP